VTAASRWIASSDRTSTGSSRGRTVEPAQLHDEKRARTPDVVLGHGVDDQFGIRLAEQDAPIAEVST